jgi:hypothetical protein
MSDELDTGAGSGGAFVQFYRWVLGIGHERNVGGAERTVRYALGGLLVVVAVALAAVPQLGTVANAGIVIALLVSGAYLIYEARVQYCPLNHTVGRSTYRE